MKFFFTSFGLHNPYICSELPDHAIYPISAQASSGLDLDYSTLLIANEYIMDEDAFDFVTEGRAYLKPMKESLLLLKREGLLKLISFSQIIEASLPGVRSRTEILLDNPTVWLDEAKEQWHILAIDLQEFNKNYGTSESSVRNTSHYGIYNHLVAKGVGFSQTDHSRILKLIGSRKKRWSLTELDDLRGVLRPLIGQLLINELVRRKIDCPFLDWDDAQGFYKKLYLGTWDDDQKEHRLQTEVRKLFSVVIPVLRPRNIDSVVRFVRDNKAIASLRQELLHAIEGNTTIDDKWFVHYLNAAVKQELTIRNKVKWLRWLGAIAGTVLPGASFVQEFAAALANEAIEGKINDSLHNYGVRNHRWYYVLQKDVGK